MSAPPLDDSEACGRAYGTTILQNDSLAPQKHALPIPLMKSGSCSGQELFVPAPALWKSMSKVWRELQEPVTSANKEAELTLQHIHDTKPAGTVTANEAGPSLRENGADLHERFLGAWEHTVIA